MKKIIYSLTILITLSTSAQNASTETNSNSTESPVSLSNAISKINDMGQHVYRTWSFQQYLKCFCIYISLQSGITFLNIVNKKIAEQAKKSSSPIYSGLMAAEEYIIDTAACISSILIPFVAASLSDKVFYENYILPLYQRYQPNK